jgi:hypothetical protein
MEKEAQMSKGLYELRLFVHARRKASESLKKGMTAVPRVYL